MSIFDQVRDQVDAAEWRFRLHDNFVVSPWSTYKDIVSSTFFPVQDAWLVARRCAFDEMYYPPLGEYRQRKTYSSLAPSYGMPFRCSISCQKLDIPVAAAIHLNNGVQIFLTASVSCSLNVERVGERDAAAVNTMSSIYDRSLYPTTGLSSYRSYRPKGNEWEMERNKSQRPLRRTKSLMSMNTENQYETKVEDKKRRNIYSVPTSTTRAENYGLYWGGRLNGITSCGALFYPSNFEGSEDRRYHRIFWGPNMIDYVTPTARHAASLLLSAY